MLHIPHYWYLANEERSIGRVDGVKKWPQYIGIDVNVIISSHEKPKLITVVIMHILQHCKRLALRRVGVINARQSDQRNVMATR